MKNGIKKTQHSNYQNEKSKENKLVKETNESLTDNPMNGLPKGHYRFFVGCNLNFETELVKELREASPFFLELDGRRHQHLLNFEVQQGGVEFTAPLHIGLQVNFFSKLANRVLVRCAQKRIKDFPAFYQWIQKQRKQGLLQSFSADHRFCFEVSASQSRLNHEKRLIEIMEEHFKRDDEAEQKIFLRVFNDDAILSIDSTGLLLHKRSQKEVGKAPLRETLAAFCFRKIMGDRNPSEIKEIVLVDPMCGSGTLLKEAANYLQPQLDREYSFLKWHQCPKILKSPSLAGNYEKFPSLFLGLRGFDIENSVLKIAHENLVPQSDVKVNQGLKTDLSVILTKMDLKNPFSEEDKAKFLGNPIWIMCNVPYGERIQTDLNINEIVQRISGKFKPIRMGLLMSDKQWGELESSVKKGIESETVFSNGGLKVHWVVWDYFFSDFR